MICRFNNGNRMKIVDVNFKERTFCTREVTGKIYSREGKTNLVKLARVTRSLIYGDDVGILSLYRALHLRVCQITLEF